MSIKVRSSLLSLVIIAVLIFSAIGPTIVYADGGTSKDTPPTETTTNDCASDGTSSECPTKAVGTTATPEAGATKEPGADTGEPSAEATAVPATEEAAPVTEETTTQTEAAPSTEKATAPSEETATLNDVPENTTVQVVNADGQSEPLATQEAADAIATTSDPIWCPAGQSPIPGANGCTQSFTSFTALLTFLSGNAAYQGAGTIYVQQGAYQGGESTVDFNNYNLSNISGADLTITGGWNTSTNTVDPAATSSFSNTSIVIGSSTNPWAGSLTISNLTLNFNPTGQSGTGLTLNSQNDINLTNVSVMNSATGAGAELNSGGDVTINNSNFDRNRTAGAIIRANGNVAISNSSFSNPVNGRRQITGLDIVNDGSVSLFNVLANTNREAGATINAGGRVTIGSSFFSDTKAMQGSNFMGYGLQVVTPDAIDLDTVTANDNFLWGASLNAGGNVTINNSIFNANTTSSPGFIDDTGLLVTSGGSVAINNSQANDNRLIGATVNAQGDVSINNSTFTNNNGVTLDSAGTPTFHGYGLQVVTPGSIFLNTVTASNNTLFGAHLEAGVDVFVSHSDFSNQTSGSATDQTGRGLEVISGGNVLLDNTTINNNQTFGAHIQAGGAVFLDTITATNNGTDGVQVQGNCTTLFLINGTYSNNGQYGLSVTNAALNQSGSPIFAANGAGDIFQDPGTCVFTVSGGSTPTTPVISQQSGNIFTSTTNNTLLGNNALNTGMNFKSTSSISSNLAKVTLNSFLANTRLANDIHVSIFMGKYVYIYSSAGMQIVAFSSSDAIAMQGPYKAY
jgi:Right handed beta helix region